MAFNPIRIIVDTQNDRKEVEAGRLLESLLRLTEMRYVPAQDCKKSDCPFKDQQE